MKKFTVRHHYNVKPSKGEVNSGEIMVEPDQSYTVQEILDKYARGISLNIADPTAYYSDTEDFDEIDERSRIKDLTDINEVDDRLEARRKKKAIRTDLKDSKTKSDSEPAESPKEA